MKIDLSSKHNNYADIQQFLLISRFDDWQIDSIKYVIEWIKIQFDISRDIQLTILGSGKYFESTSRLCKSYNNNLKYELFKLEGHVENVADYIIKSDFVFSKGRGLVDSIYLNKFCAVISENKIFALIKPHNILNLMYYNFSGRNISKEDEFSDNIKHLRINKPSKAELIEMSNIVDKHYNSKYLCKKIDNIIDNSVEKTRKNPSNFATIIYLSIFTAFLTIRIILERLCIKKRDYKNE
jgi:hypothetical protein